MPDDDIAHTLARYDWIAVIALVVVFVLLALTGNPAYPNW